MVVRISDKTQNYSKVTKLLVKPKINYVDKQDVILQNNVKLPVSRFYKKNFEEAWINEMSKSI